MFPDLKDKKFTDISLNESFVVIDQFEDIAILDNKQRVHVNRLLDKNFYEMYIDPSSFFGDKHYQMFADKIKSIPMESINEMKDDDSAVIQYDPEEERRLLEEKARKMYGSVSEQSQNQLDKFKEYLDDDNDIPVIQPFQSPSIQPQPQSIREVSVQPQVIQEDPMKIMFKNIKKNTDLKISFDINDKIPRPDFIEMMEDSYEVSLIEYLADEFTKKILDNPSIIKDKIKEEINNIVYGKKEQTDIIKVDPMVINEGSHKNSKPLPPPTKILREGENPKKVRKIPNVPPSDRTVLHEGVIPTPPSPPSDRKLKEGKEPPKPKNYQDQ